MVARGVAYAGRRPPWLGAGGPFAIISWQCLSKWTVYIRLRKNQPTLLSSHNQTRGAASGTAARSLTQEGCVKADDEEVRQNQEEVFIFDRIILSSSRLRTDDFNDELRRSKPEHLNLQCVQIAVRTTNPVPSSLVYTSIDCNNNALQRSFSRRK